MPRRSTPAAPAEEVSSAIVDALTDSTEGEGKKGRKKRGEGIPPRPKGPFSELDAFTVLEVAGLLQISESQVARLIRDKELGHIKIGTSTRVTFAQYKAHLRKREIESGFQAAA